ncbi:MAG: glutamate-5-semialdehyde dehydrogenase [Candidatus Omnitrophica bacterium]|jgi:glutamate-5-semialdehyde dehydrogenase|nr:glutamate-5-semialdehyde dehydrogenase [Candidatus Omnitrophota bacterium]
MTWQEIIKQQIKNVKQASFEFSQLTGEKKNKFLLILSSLLEEKKEEIIHENSKDIEQCKKNNYSKSFIDRLLLTPERISKMSNSLKDVSALKDPVGEIFYQTVRPNGLIIKKIRVPIGVIGIIYESRPDVTIEAASLCIKSGNCVVLKGGKESINSNIILTKIIQQALKKTEINSNGIHYISIGGRQAVRFILKMKEYIDLIIPRGGESLIEAVTNYSRIPVIKHYKGICHTYVDIDADLAMAQNICYNAKIQRPATCNAMETLLVHKGIAEKFLPDMAKIFKQANVEMRGCPETLSILPDIISATEEDWDKEYLDLILSIKIVQDIDEAIAHINKYGTKHSDAIITNNQKTAEKFLLSVDSACVYHNASTRFTDGGEFGMGAEIGISTDKIHARGPMALEELTIYKYLIYGNGQVRK